VILAAEANLARVIVQQRALQLQQLALVTQGKVVSYSAALKARGAVMTAAGKENRGSRMSARSTLRTAKFSVKSSPPDTPTPDYEPADSFSNDQLVDLDVTVDVASLLPEWLRKLLPNEKLTVSSHCQATIEKQENTWVETLNQVR
jgi:hypothetical protein